MLEGLARAGRFAAECASAARDVATWWPQTAPQVLELGVKSLPIGAFDSSTSRGEVRRIVQDAGEAARQLREASSRVLRLSGQLDTAQATLTSVLAHSDAVMRRIHAGEGSLGLFLTGSSVYRQTDSLLTQLRRLVADVQSNPRKYLRVSLF